MSKLLLIDDEADVQYSFRRIFDSAEIEVLTANSGEAGLEMLKRVQPDLVIMDIRMGGMNGLETLRRLREADTRLLVIMMTAYGTTQTAIEAMKLGAYDYLLKPFDVPKLKELVFTALRAARDMKQVVKCPLGDGTSDLEQGILGRSEVMQRVFKLIGQLAASDATALITGESGTGKELVARAIYHHSRRNDRPFLAINCAAIPENLLESELFGHERGAFTGAVNQRIGKFEQCNKGTLFLDEIGDMPLATQTKILRVLQDGRVERVGGNQPVKMDVRILAATNKNLEAAVAAKQFREDLFYRLNVVRIQLPPLRERREDIGMLAAYFLRTQAAAQGVQPRSFGPGVAEALERFPWPGNVRQLENVMNRANVLAKTPVLGVEDLPREILSSERLDPADAATVTTFHLGAVHAVKTGVEVLPAGESQFPLEQAISTLFAWARGSHDLKIIPAIERELVIRALRETAGNQVQAAKMLGITRATLRKRVEKYKIQQQLDVR